MCGFIRRFYDLHTADTLQLENFDMGFTRLSGSLQMTLT